MHRLLEELHRRPKLLDPRQHAAAPALQDKVPKGAPLFEDLRVPERSVL
jgi:hypothetical protein